MYWLAINREGITPARLQAEFLPGITLPTLLTALEALHNRSSILRCRRCANETTEMGLTQQPVVMEYVTERFIQEIERGIITGKLDLFNTHLLIEAQTKDYLREAQIQLILQPLIDRLLTHFITQTQLEQHLAKLLTTLRHQAEPIAGYAAGNLLNLFCYLKTNLQGYDFSHLWIRQAYLLNATLHDVDFTGSHISQTVFAETFGGVVGIKFSPDGQYLATSDTKGDIQIWDADTLTKRINCQEHQHWTWAIDFSPDGQYLASASDDGSVKLWACPERSRRDVATGECLYTYKGHTFLVNTIEFSPCGQIIASSSQDGSIRLWRVLPGTLNPEIQTLMGHNGRVWSIAFSPDGNTIVSGGEDLTVRLWDVATGKCLAEWAAHTDWVRFVAFSPDGRSIATASYDRSIKIWEVAKIPDFSKKSGICVHTLVGHQQAVSSIAFSPDGRQLVSSSFDKTIKVWDTNSGKCLKTLLGHRSRIWTVAFHPNGRTIASGGDDNCTLLASGSADHTIKIWDWNLNNCLQTLHGHKSWVWKVAFSPCGQILASSSYDQTVKIWDIQTD
jgi:WD40 repeat protein